MVTLKLAILLYNDTTGFRMANIFIYQYKIEDEGGETHKGITFSRSEKLAVEYLKNKFNLGSILKLKKKNVFILKVTNFILSLFKVYPKRKAIKFFLIHTVELILNNTVNHLLSGEIDSHSGCA